MEVIVLAAGKGTRMYSQQPKVLHTIGGKPMLDHVLGAARTLEASPIHVVVGHEAEAIKAHVAESDVAPHVNWVTQSQQLGTGHAVMQALPDIDTGSRDNLVVILYGDVPLIKPDTLSRLLTLAAEDAVAVLTVTMQDPSGLGRILRNESGEITAIVEEKDANDEQLKIQEINSGILALPATTLGALLPRIENNNAQSEYYLTDLIELAVTSEGRVTSLNIGDPVEVQGVNDRVQLAHLERHYQDEKATDLLRAGVTLRDPARFDVRGELQCGRDVEIDVDVVFEGTVTLGDDVKVGSHCVIKDAQIADGTTILPGCQIEGARIGQHATIGPCARIRPGTVLRDRVKIGNFVETKNAVIGEGSKANHLAYIGDAEIGSECNIGAGTIFCNYDGANKHKTVLGNKVFVGSNSVLVAPVTLADDSFVAAGSAVNCDVPADHLAVARGRQRNIAGWKKPRKK